MVFAFSYPGSFWITTDYEPLGLADAMNMAYRLADRKMYEAVRMAHLPGVPFYLLSWLALALNCVFSVDPRLMVRAGNWQVLNSRLHSRLS